MKSKPIEPFFNELDKKSKIYKFFDIFLSDPQKESALLGGAVNVLWVAYHMPIISKFVKEEICESGAFVKCITENYVCFVAFDSSNKITDILHRPRGIFTSWSELKLPNDMCNLLSPLMEKIKFRKSLNGIMNMKVFW